MRLQVEGGQDLAAATVRVQRTQRITSQVVQADYPTPGGLAGPLHVQQPLGHCQGGIEVMFPFEGIRLAPEFGGTHRCAHGSRSCAMRPARSSWSLNSSVLSSSEPSRPAATAEAASRSC